MALLSRSKLSESKRRIPFNWPGPWIWLVAAAAGLLFSYLPTTQAALLLAALAVVILTSIQPLIGLGVALLVGPFGALESVLLGGVSLDSGQLFLGLALATWIGRKLMSRSLALPHSPLTWPLLLLIAVNVLSLTSASDLDLAVKETLKWVEVLAVMLLVTDLGNTSGAISERPGQASEVNGARGIAWILVMLFSAGIVQALIGIWQFALRGDGPEHFLVLGRFYRAYGTFEQPNPYGGYMNMTALLALGVLIGLVTWWLLLRSNRAAQTAGSSRWLHGVLGGLAVTAVFILSAAALFFSWSRGAWMGFAAGALVMAVFWPRKLRYGLVVLAFAILAFGFLLQANLLPPTVVERIGGFADDLTFGDVRGVDINDENYAVLERLAHWQAAVDMARDHLWLGVGPGNYGASYASYALINWPDPLGHAHNLYLNMLAEVGLIGLAAYFLFWTAVFWQTLRALAQAEWPLRGVALGLLGIWTAISVHHLVDKLYVNNIYIHLGVLLGLLQLVGLRAASTARVRENGFG